MFLLFSPFFFFSGYLWGGVVWDGSSASVLALPVAPSCISYRPQLFPSSRQCRHGPGQRTAEEARRKRRWCPPEPPPAGRGGRMSARAARASPPAPPPRPRPPPGGTLAPRGSPARGARRPPQSLRLPEARGCLFGPRWGRPALRMSGSPASP